MVIPCFKCGKSTETNFDVDDDATVWCVDCYALIHANPTGFSCQCHKPQLINSLCQICNKPFHTSINSSSLKEKDD